MKSAFAKRQQRPGQRKGQRENRVLELDHVERQPKAFQEHREAIGFRKLPFYRMTEDHLRGLLEDVRSGAADVDAALHRLRHMPFEDLGFAKVDHHRALRHGIPEVVFGLGQDALIMWLPSQARLLERGGGNVLITRATPAMAERVLQELPGGEYFPLSGAIRFWRDRAVHGKGKIAVVCAGTSDIPVAEEAQVTAEVDGQSGGFDSRYRRRRDSSAYGQ